MAVAKERFPDESAQIATLPNLLSLLRLLLVIPFARYAMRGADQSALYVFLLAGITDALDGQLARRLGQTSKLGRIVDPIADKLLTCVAYVVLSFFRPDLSAIPMWAAIAVVGRDIIILVGAAVVYLSIQTTAFRPSVLGKLNTFVEIGVVVWFLAATAIPQLQPFLPSLYALLFASILFSTADYIAQGFRMLRK